MIFKYGRKIFAVIPYLMFFNYCQADKEYAQNVKTIRTFIEGVIEDRKKNFDKNKDSSDLLNILITDSLFEKDNKAMIDELVTFFLAGSFTLKTTNSNLIQYLGLNPHCYDKLMKEIKETILKDHF